MKCPNVVPWVAPTVLLFAACSREPPPTPPSTDLSHHQKIADAVRAGETLVLYEGLPHHHTEPDLLAAEIRSKNPLRLHRFPFYRSPIMPSADDGRRLTALYCDPASMRPYEGPKLCNGFHPDWCLEWRVGEDTYHALICFGCDEIMSYGPDIDVYCDVTQTAFHEMIRILSPYRKNRPKSPWEK